MFIKNNKMPTSLVAFHLKWKKKKKTKNASIGYNATIR